MPPDNHLRKVWDAGEGDVKLPPRDRPPEEPEKSCPVTPLGHRGNDLYFLDVRGQERRLNARELCSRAGLALLFVGKTSWLEQHFPRTAMRRTRIDNQLVEEEIVTGIAAAPAGEFLMRLCADAGLFGDHILLRQPGIWPDGNGIAVHSGDEVLVAGEWRRAGFRSGAVVWGAAPPTPRPGDLASSQLAQDYQREIRDTWCFCSPGGEILVIGALGLGYLGAVPRWRSNLFLLGSASAGKSMLLELLVALSPLHHFTKNTSGPGLEQAVNGRAVPIFVDEAADRADQRGATALMDLVLSATGGDGSRGHRGTISGQVRRVDVVGSIVMASINPPEMRPQHLGRFSLVELAGAEDGADHRARMEALIAAGRRDGPALWGRAIAGWPRWSATLEKFRAALGFAGCAPREMDQLGALLTGWWILTEDGEPDIAQARAGVVAITEFVRGAAAVRSEDSPRRAVTHLASSMVNLHRSSERAPVGELADVAWKGDTDAGKLLTRYGMRTVLKCGNAHCNPECDRPYCKGNIPRATPRQAGIWLSTRNPELSKLFHGSPFEGERWLYEMQRLPSARKSDRNVRIGAVSGRAVWLSREDFLGLDDDEKEGD